MRDFTRYEEPTQMHSPSDEELELFHGYEHVNDEIISERNKPFRDPTDEFDDEFDVDNYVDKENVLFEEGLFDEAQSTSSKYALKMRQQRNYQKQIADAIHKINKYIVVGKNGRRHFVLPKENLATLAARLRIDPKLLKILLKSATTNNLNRKNSRPIQAELELENLSCPGKSGRTHHWWGYKDYVNNCDTLTMIDVLNATAGSLAVCGAVYPPCLVLTGFVGGGAVVTGAWINFINRQGGNRGIVVKTVFNQVPVIWHQ